MATDAEKDLFSRNVLREIGLHSDKFGDDKIVGFLAMSGRKSEGGLMVVGRAVNRWDEEIDPIELNDVANCAEYAKKVQDSVLSAPDACPMGWVTQCWGSSDGYNAKRSAFWRSIRHVVKDLRIADTDGSDWSSYLVWSNLYKVAPEKGGNPNRSQRAIQLHGCVDLFHLELRTYCPGRVLFLTGADWAEPFVKHATLTCAADHNQYVKQIGQLRGARCVVAVHPQGKPEPPWVREVVAAFSI